MEDDDLKYCRILEKIHSKVLRVPPMRVGSGIAVVTFRVPPWSSCEQMGKVALAEWDKAADAKDVYIQRPPVNPSKWEISM